MSGRTVLWCHKEMTDGTKENFQGIGAAQWGMEFVSVVMSILSVEWK